jgi:hypothetical protein
VDTEILNSGPTLADILTQKEVAALTRIPLSTLRSRLDRAAVQRRRGEDRRGVTNQIHHGGGEVSREKCL